MDCAGVNGWVGVMSVGQDIPTGDWDNWLARLRERLAWLLAEFNSV